MAAQTFNEWFQLVTDTGESDILSGFTTKGVAHLAWDAAIKSLEGVPERAPNSTKPETISPCHNCPGEPLIGERDVNECEGCPITEG
jgi:hypothetical protein